MNGMMKLKRYMLGAILLLMFAVMSAGSAHAAATMDSYCSIPPFVATGMTPNLLLMLDNSASMYDLSYADKGAVAGYCSITNSQQCGGSFPACPSGESCVSTTRSSTYCYDQTYNSINSYTGYFDYKDAAGNDVTKTTYYAYDFTNQYFYRVATFPSAVECSKYVNNVLCVNISGTLKFVANGSYLNWLTSSKFDVEKKILTGGKYVGKLCFDSVKGLTASACSVDGDCASGQTCNTVTTPFLQGESRGCVGRQFIKEPLSSNNGNYQETTLPGTNTSLGITFGIRGPVSEYNPTSPSSGGQTFIGIYNGNYNSELCQAAIDAIIRGQSTGDIKKAVNDCLSYSTTMSTCAQDAGIPCTVDSNCLVANSGICAVLPKRCSLYTSRSCTLDSDCVLSDGICTTGSKVCSLNTTRTCTNDNGCKKTDGACSNSTKKCTNTGSTYGLTCSNNNDCNNTDGTCITPNAACTGGKVGSACTTNSDCNTNYGFCQSPVSTCLSSSDPAKVGAACTTNEACYQSKGPCLGGGSSSSKEKVVFTQTIQACWALSKGTALGIDDVNTVKNQCNDLYSTDFKCLGGSNAGAACTLAADCPGGACASGPSTITPGNPSYLCSITYAGACYDTATSSWSATKCSPADPSKCGTDCILERHAAFCNSMNVPPVVDPTNAPSETVNYDNLPAIIGDVGIESQLGEPYPVLKVRVVKDKVCSNNTTIICSSAADCSSGTCDYKEPSGIVQNFDGKIRMGLMTFNYNGSETECTTSTTLASGDIACPKKCSNNPSIACGSIMDCPQGTNVTCDATVRGTENKDGAKIQYYIGQGLCHDQYDAPITTKPCWTDAHCSTSAGEFCVIDSVGSHALGGSLIQKLDAIKGSDWTPFGEGFYDAIGYFAPGVNADGTPNGNSRSDMYIKAGDFDTNKNPSQYYCQNNNVLLISDGMSTADQNPALSSLIGHYPQSGTYSACSKYKGSSALEDLAWIAQNKKINASDLLTATSTAAPQPNERITTWIVMSGPSNGESNIACNSEYLLKDTAFKGSQGAYPMQKAEDPEKLDAALKTTLEAIANRAASGSAVSVLTTSSRGVGSMLQAYFLPTVEDNGNTIRWLGYTQNIWIDPNDNLREDTTPDSKLVLNSLNSPGDGGDRVMRLFFDSGSNETKAALFTTDADGKNGTLAQCSGYDVMPFQSISPLWEGGKALAKMVWDEPSEAEAALPFSMPQTKRHIFSAASGTNGGGFNQKFGIQFTTANMGDSGAYTAFRDALNPDAPGGTFTADKIIQYTRGKALEGLENTTSDADKFRKRLRTIDGDTANPKVWKLGDVINSTPKVVGNTPQNTYFIDYGDTSYYHFVSSDAYRRRTSVALIGSNDGMLHAFRVGYLKDKDFQPGDTMKAFFRDAFGTRDDVSYGSTTHGELGKELWAYIPYNVLPYLKYYASSQYGNPCHIYSVDLSVKVYDASIGPVPVGGDTATPTPGGAKSADTWRTILLGGLRFGGACTGAAGGSDKPGVLPTSSAGFSSFFALDITDPEKPVPLWEFWDQSSASDSKSVGFATSSPAIIRTGDPAQNGSWYVAFGSGPTQLAASRRDIARSRGGYLYILKLYTGELVARKALNYNGIVGDILVIDKEKDYHSEKIYFGTSVCLGYPATPSLIYSETSDGKRCIGQWNGFVSSVDVPTDLTSSPTLTIKALFKTTAPFTASPDAAKDDKGNVWVYAGTGKFYSTVDQDDVNSQQWFVGFIDKGSSSTLLTAATSTTCPSSCTSTTALCDVTDCKMEGDVPTTGGTIEACVFDGEPNSATRNTFQKRTIVTMITNPPAVPQSPIGWAIRLPKPEKSISRPLAVGGVVDFLTYKPSSNKCEHGGDSYLYAVDYQTGVAPSSVAIRALGNTVDSNGAVKTSDHVEVLRRIRLGPGAPPTGEAIIITPPKEGQEKLKKKIQVATGVIVESENKPMISTVSKIMHWLKK